MKISGNTILVTGGTSGIGRALAEALHARDNQVIIAGRRQVLLDAITAANPGMHGIAVDVADAEAIAPFAQRVADRFPALNVLINNAGMMRREDLVADEVDLPTALATIDTNLTSVLRLTAALLPTLKRQPASTIMTTTSGLAFMPLHVFPTYCATKAFLHSWLQSLRAQLADSPVEVLELAPPYVQTELTGAHQANDPHAMPLADYIAEVMQLLEQCNHPAGEVLVERVKMLRYAERDGKYDEVRTMVNAPFASA
jgi:uncharacterized oxidoreductase